MNEQLRHIIVVYLFILGCALIVYAALELAFREKMFSFQKKWVNHKLFPLHGLLLISGGLPLTFFKQTLSGKIMLIIGIIVVLTGIFIILYPSKMRSLYNETESEITRNRDNLVTFDAFIRIFSGICILYNMIRYEKMLLLF